MKGFFLKIKPNHTMEKNEKMKKLIRHCSVIVNHLLENGYLSDSSNQEKFEQLKKILKNKERKFKN